MIYVPEPMVSIFKSVFRYLNMPEHVADYGDYREENGGVLLKPAVYDPPFWDEFLLKQMQVEKMGNRQRAYSVGCKVAEELDRWKLHMEKFPAVVRRAQVCRHIDDFVHQALINSNNEQEAAEAVGLGIARMDTIERRLKVKEEGLCFAIAGDSRYIGNKKWRYKFESMLPKNVRFCYCYAHGDLMLPNSEALQWFNNLNLVKQSNRYAYQGKLWLLRSEHRIDGVIFVHNKESALVHVKQKEVLFCKGNLKDEQFGIKLEEFCTHLKNKAGLKEDV